MKVAVFEHRSDGAMVPCQPVHQERLTLSAFRQIHGGELAPLPHKYLPAPDGFSIWKTRLGEIFAVRDE